MSWHWMHTYCSIHQRCDAVDDGSNPTLGVDYTRKDI
jgi:hypothetical protein